MKTVGSFGLAGSAGLAWSLLLACTLMPEAALRAQETGQATEIQQLQQQLRKLQENFEETLRQQHRQIEALQKQIDALQSKTPAGATSPTPAAPGSPNEVKETQETKPAWSPTAPITLFGGQRNYLNLSFDALFAAGSSTADDIPHLQLGGHDPVQRGFTVQNLETVFEGYVDPYFRGQASLVGHIAPDGDFHFEAEEAYLVTIALPANLQVKAGQFLTEFGRINPTHPHTWSFVDAPLVAGRFFGAEGLRNPGARISWIVPTPFYSELFFTVQNSQGSTAYSFRGSGEHGGPEDNLIFGRERIGRETDRIGDMLFAPRYAVSFDLTENQTVLIGASAAFGPNNSGPDTDTQIFGMDFLWKWKSPRHHRGFPFVAWQTEVMARRFEAGAFALDENGDGLLDVDLPRETLWDYGLYSQLTWGFQERWVAGLRGDWVSGERGAFYPDPDRDTRWRISPNLTWFPTEFSKLRLQYNYDDRENIGVDHSVWLQFEFMLGSHAAHKF
ncbi:MAG: TonB-dependent receptor [Verrucomicrobiota bacterium]|nr:TonB-dependent receptor [Verrucomicrobiota bacterium]